MKRKCFVFLILILSVLASAQESPVIKNPETSEEQQSEKSKDELIFQDIEPKKKDPFFKKKSTEYPITLGLFTFFNNGGGLISFLTFLYPPVSLSIVNYDSHLDAGSVYEIAANNAFFTNGSVDIGMHIKADLDIYYNSFGAGGGFAGGLYAHFNEIFMLKIGGRAAMYKLIPFAGPETSIEFTADSIKFDCTFCYGFAEDNKRLWRAAVILGFFVD